MVHKRHKSKRQTLKKKYFIEKRVRAHGRKVRRQARKNPVRGKLQKDPGVPNLYPFKQQFIAKLERMKAKEERDAVLRRERRTKEREKRRQMNLQSMVENARERENFFNLQEEKKEKQIEQATSNKDNSRKTYYREFKKVVATADVILEVLDARDPLGCRCKEVEQMIMTQDPNKKIVLILNKIDLVPKENVENWLQTLRNEYPTLAFKSSTQKQRRNLSQRNTSIEKAKLSTSDCLGADNLLQLLKNYSRKSEMKTSISVGIIGYPNVGKSSLINSLKRSRAVGVGATPGYTKNMQEIAIDKHIKLIDCPGIVFSTEASDSDLVLRNCVKVDQLVDPIAPVEKLIKRCSRLQLLQIYKIPMYDDCKEFLSHIAHKIGRLGKGGVPDYGAAARKVLEDWISGKIAFYTEPPRQKAQIQASVVQEWSKEFRIDDIIKREQENVFDNFKSSVDEDNMMSMGNKPLFHLSPDNLLVEHLAEDSSDEEEPMDADQEVNPEQMMQLDRERELEEATIKKKKTKRTRKDQMSGHQFTGANNTNLPAFSFMTDFVATNEMDQSDEEEDIEAIPIGAEEEDLFDVDDL